jgi:hypothetical protein
MRFGPLLAATAIVSLTLLGVACGSSDPSGTMSGSTPDGGATDGASDGSVDGSTPVSDAGTDAPAPDDDGGLFEITGGTFNALTLNQLDGTATTDTTGLGTELIILISDHAGLCSTGANRQNEITFSVDALSNQNPFATGTYTETGNPDTAGNADTVMSKLGPTCAAIGQDYAAAVGSTVVIKNVTPTYVAGTFDLTFENDAGTLQGSFHVPFCDHALNLTCQP